MKNKWKINEKNTKNKWKNMKNKWKNTKKYIETAFVNAFYVSKKKIELLKSIQNNCINF